MWMESNPAFCSRECIAAELLFFKSMLDTALLTTLELLTPAEQKSIQALAEFLKSQRAEGAIVRQAAVEDLLAELPMREPQFSTSDDGLSPARLAARRFMRENPALMHLLAR